MWNHVACNNLAIQWHVSLQYDGLLQPFAEENSNLKVLNRYVQMLRAVVTPSSGFALLTVHPVNARFQNFYRHVLQLLEKCTQNERKSSFLVTLISISCRKLGPLSDQVIISRIFATDSASRTQYKSGPDGLLPNLLKIATPVIT